MKVAKILYIRAVPTGLALLVIWQGAVIRSRGYRLQDLKERCARERVRTKKYKAQINKLQSPMRVMHLVRKHQLDLKNAPVPPAPPTAENRGDGNEDDSQSGSERRENAGRTGSTDSNADSSVAMTPDGHSERN